MLFGRRPPSPRRRKTITIIVEFKYQLTGVCRSRTIRTDLFCWCSCNNGLFVALPLFVLPVRWFVNVDWVCQNFGTLFCELKYFLSHPNFPLNVFDKQSWPGISRFCANELLDFCVRAAMATSAPFVLPLIKRLAAERVVFCRDASGPKCLLIFYIHRV